MKFQKPDPNRQKERERIAEESRQASDEVIAAAQNCLRTEQFAQYAKQLQRTHDLMWSELQWIDRHIHEPLEYAFTVKDIIAKQRHLSVLLESIHMEAGKK